jgi:hypothetical protein
VGLGVDRRRQARGKQDSADRPLHDAQSEYSPEFASLSTEPGARRNAAVGAEDRDHGLLRVPQGPSSRSFAPDIEGRVNALVLVVMSLVFLYTLLALAGTLFDEEGRRGPLRRCISLISVGRNHIMPDSSGAA